MALGIDPGLSTTGYGLVRRAGDGLTLVAYGCIAPRSALTAPQRLQVIYQELGEIIATQEPTEVAVERLFFSKNVRTAMAVGQARGVALLAATNAGLPIYEYTPSEVKQSLVGYGRASKGQVQELVKVVLGLDYLPQPDDAADALAVAICHLYCVDVARLLEES